MAKVKAAFWGLGASKSIGDSIVFYKRKGVQCVREKVTPANPNTTAQQVERTQFTEGVDQWHDIKLLAKDKTAWNTRATIIGGGQSGFNQLISNVRKYPSTNDHTLLYNIKMVTSGANQIPKVTADAAGTCTFKIIRGPNAGFSNTQTLVADTEKAFNLVPTNSGSICVFEMTAANKTGESGYFKAVALA
jgi:hypothetical protein